MPQSPITLKYYVKRLKRFCHQSSPVNKDCSHLLNLDLLEQILAGPDLCFVL
jgi:hypothetical protein